MYIKKKLFSKKQISKIDRNLNKVTSSNGNYLGAALTICVATALLTTMASDAIAAGTAVDVPFVDNLKETVKDLMTGAGSFVIDAMILLGGGWASIRTSTPAPIVLAILSVFIFEICVSLITK